MAKRRNTILEAQDEYLRTQDPSALERMYKDLLSLGYFILARLGRYQDEENVNDIATDLIMRLMEKKEPVINGAPSAYLKVALFYKNKRKQGPEDLDENEDLEAGEGDALWSYVDKVVREAGLSDSDADMLARQTVESRTRWKLVYRNIPDPVLRKEYKAKMKEIERCVRSSANNQAASGQ